MTEALATLKRSGFVEPDQHNQEGRIPWSAQSLDTFSAGVLGSGHFSLPQFAQRSP